MTTARGDESHPTVSMCRESVQTGLDHTQGFPVSELSKTVAPK